MTRSCTIGVDLGGTAIKAGLVDGSLDVVARTMLPTCADQGADAVIQRIAAAVDELRAANNSHVVAVGVGTPGPMSPSKGVVYRSGNLPGWQDVLLRDILERRLNLPVTIDNDANVAAYGEHRAEPTVRNLVLLTLGTGVGAGTITDGAIFHGAHENASEWGHMIVHPGGIPCTCGQCGCLEMYASAAHVAIRVADEIRSGSESSLGDVQVITAREVAAAASAGDALCTRIWDEACHALAIACVNIQHAINPECVLLGGGMSNAGDVLLDNVRRQYSAMHWHLYDDSPSIRLASLSNDAGIIGAAALARDVLVLK